MTLLSGLATYLATYEYNKENERKDAFEALAKDAVEKREKVLALKAADLMAEKEKLEEELEEIESEYLQT